MNPICRNRSLHSLGLRAKRSVNTGRLWAGGLDRRQRVKRDAASNGQFQDLRCAFDLNEAFTHQGDAAPVVALDAPMQAC